MEVYLSSQPGKQVQTRNTDIFVFGLNDTLPEQKNKNNYATENFCVKWNSKDGFDRSIDIYVDEVTCRAKWR